MALSNATRDSLIKDDLEGFIWVVEAPPHEEPKVAPPIDLEELSKGTMQAVNGLSSGAVYSIENPSTQILTEYFGKFLIARKA